MDRTYASAIEDSDLKLYAVPDSSLPKVDLTSKVMERIQRVETKSEQRTRRPRKRSALIATLGAVVLLSSVSVYAATEYVQIRNAAGQIVIKTIPAPKWSAHWSELRSKYVEQIRGSMKPGDVVIYYIADEQVNSENGQTYINFDSKLDYDSYDDYMKWMKKSGAPTLEKPVYLPKGFKFDVANLQPEIPWRGINGKVTEYDRVMDRLMKKASIAKDGNKLFIEKVGWTKANLSQIRYTKGTDYIHIYAQQASEKYKSPMMIFQGENVKSETITLAGKEVIYMTDAGKTSFSNSIRWYDEEENAVYTVENSKDSTVSGKELKKVAESMLAARTKRK